MYRHLSVSNSLIYLILRAVIGVHGSTFRVVSGGDSQPSSKETYSDNVFRVEQKVHENTQVGVLVYGLPV
jgi:hypothetical protein